ncbi:MAG: DNA polymerase III subunit beta, partial [Oscillibacter sp.]|nr:DNA polymerase III subunit beta [Oscillibacter sp.]
RRLEGEFLNYRTSIPRNGPFRLKANTRELMDSIDRVSVVITEKTKAPVRCRFDNGRVLLTARTAFGEAKDLCPIDGDGGGLEIGFNNRYLLEALRFAPADTVRMELNTSISPAVLVPEEEWETGQEKFVYMVLPVRLKA